MQLSWYSTPLTNNPGGNSKGRGRKRGSSSAVPATKRTFVGVAYVLDRCLNISQGPRATAAPLTGKEKRQIAKALGGHVNVPASSSVLDTLQQTRARYMGGQHELVGGDSTTSLRRSERRQSTQSG